MADMFYMRLLLAILLGAPLCTLAQQSKEAPPEIDTQELTNETEQMDNHGGKIGLFWWVPVEFWEQSAVQSGANYAIAKKTFAPLANYNLFIIGVGTYNVGGISWAKEQDIRRGVVLRDQAGNTYKPLESVAEDAQNFSDLMKPILKNILGPMGEGVQLFFFPKKDAQGKEFADPRRTSELTLLVTDLMDPGVSSYVWRLPLTSLLPVKYCPVGKEKVKANWKYCPWHGNKLQSDLPPVETPKTAAPNPGR
jgi:hypothetical protein